MRRTVAIGVLALLPAVVVVVEAQPFEASADRGQALFGAYCASCHGASGKGDGPGAVNLKKAPPDLTRIRETHGGRFPRAFVESYIEGATPSPAHGTREMPVWGKIFHAQGGGSYGERAKIHALTEYLESIQR
jgi:mono/diheme cytochrome c family protein